MTDTQDEDLILISDLDEIPNLDGLDISKVKNNIVIFEQKMFIINLIFFTKNINGSEQKLLKEKILYLHNG